MRSSFDTGSVKQHTYGRTCWGGLLFFAQLLFPVKNAGVSAECEHARRASCACQGAEKSGSDGRLAQSLMVLSTRACAPSTYDAKRHGAS